MPNERLQSIVEDARERARHEKDSGAVPSPVAFRALLKLISKTPDRERLQLLMPSVLKGER